MLWWVLQGTANYAIAVGIGGLVVSGWLEKRWGAKATALLHCTGRTRSILVLAHGSSQRVRIDWEYTSRCSEGDRVVSPAEASP